MIARVFPDSVCSRKRKLEDENAFLIPNPI